MYTGLFSPCVKIAILHFQTVCGSGVRKKKFYWPYREYAVVIFYLVIKLIDYVRLSN